MTAALSVLTCLLCVYSTYATGLPPGSLFREQTGGANTEVTLTHGRLGDSKLTASCLNGGKLQVSLKGRKGTATIAFAEKDVDPAAGCVSDDLTFTGVMGEEAKSYTYTSTDNCNRFVKIVNSKQQYEWSVIVTENIEEAEKFRKFPSAVNIKCILDASSPGSVQTDTGVAVIARDDASFSQTITFSIVKSIPARLDKKWQFELYPSVRGSLGVLNFQIVECTAKPVSDSNLLPAAVLIKDSCISDPGTEVEVADSPTTQKIIVYPFQFKSPYDTAEVVLTCTVKLCQDTPASDGVSAANCATLRVANCDGQGRKKRALGRLYLALTV